MACITEEDCYKMTADPRGLCVIIDNVTKEGERVSGKNDQIVETFKKLHFTVTLHMCLNHDEFLQVMADLAATDHSGYDCVIVFIKTHGERGVNLRGKGVDELKSYIKPGNWGKVEEVIKTNHHWKREFIQSDDGEEITVDELKWYLKPENCESLAGKPKLIFIEACRGHKVQFPVKHRSVSEDEVDAVVFTEDYVSNDADFFIGYSTTSSFVSYKGCFSKIVLDTLDERTESDHLLDIMTVVNRKMSEIPHATERINSNSEETSESKTNRRMPRRAQGNRRTSSRAVQTSLIESTLTKKVFFKQLNTK